MHTAIRERLLDRLNWLLLPLLILIIVWTMEQSARGFKMRREGFEIILPAPATEDAEHFPS
jgi:hypothetical protein